MKRAVVIACRFASLIFLPVLVAACGGGGDGGPPPISVVAITITGVPAAPLAPLQTSQLAARATYSDGSAKDVTTSVTWSTSNTAVLTVSASETVAAAGPGQAEVIASIGGVSGRAGVQVVALPAAYFINGVEYAFDYQLDAQGRVDNYQISQRPGATYPIASASDANVTTCTGNLSSDYRCTRLAIYVGSQSMSGASGRLTSLASSNIESPNWGCGTTRQWSYAYVAQGLASVSFGSSSTFHVSGLPGCFSGDSSTRTSTLIYDAAGRLAGVTSGYGEDCVYSSYPPYARSKICTPVGPSSVVVRTDSQGRLQRAESAETVEIWSYTQAGLMEKRVSTRADAQGEVLAASTVTYAVDSQGWLRSRSVRSESPVQPATEVIDAYAVTRVGNQVAEEEFTQAEPSAFYLRAPQRVRYEWNRLPTEPAFVPRALTGLNGADYFGIISSHHR